MALNALVVKLAFEKSNPSFLLDAIQIIKEDGLTGLMIFGAGGHATSVVNVALNAGFSVTHLVDDRLAGQCILGVTVINCKESEAQYSGQALCVAIGDNRRRESVFNQLVKRYPKAQFPVLAHTSSVVGAGASLGPGCVLMPFAQIGPNSSVGAGCIINSMASIDHDCKIADFVSLAPGVITGGNVALGNRAVIGLSAALHQGIEIGPDVVIGAKSYVNACFLEACIAYGSPAKYIRDH